jgi:hypothetical protein
VTGSTPSLIVHLQSRRRARAQVVQKLQHALPATVLLPDGLARLAGGPGGFGYLLGAAEVAVSALVIVSMFLAIRGIRGGKAPAPAASHDGNGHGVDWIDIMLAALLATEAIVHREETGHLPRPTIVLAAVMLLFGLLHGRIAARAGARRALRITADGVSMSGRFFRRLTATWAEIASLDIGTTEATLTTRDGRRQRLDLADLVNTDEARAALNEARSRLDAHRAAAAAAAAALGAATSPEA